MHNTAATLHLAVAVDGGLNNSEIVGGGSCDHLGNLSTNAAVKSSVDPAGSDELKARTDALGVNIGPVEESIENS
jgi:hypothetical protein